MPYLSRISSASISARGLDLDVVARDGRGVDDHVRALDVRRLVADEHLRAKGLQALDGLAATNVRAGDAVPEIQQDLGDPRHPGAADADEVDLLVALKHGRAG